MITTELIDSMRSLLGGRPTTVAAEVVALEYAQHCRAVNERLAKIALMLEGGGEIQALQFAEQAPRVVDAALALSFGSEAEWQEYCRDHGHEVAPMVEARTVEALLEIQGKGLASNHPLYKDYRAAVSSRDDERAHGLIRIIVRMNPGDDNAAKELKRLQRKALQAALTSLRANLESGDDIVLAAMTQVEEAGIAADYESFPEWKQAVAVRNRVRRTAARLRMPEVLGLAAEELKRGEWRQAAVLHMEYTVLESTYGLGNEQDGLQDQARVIDAELVIYRAEAERLAQVKHLIAEMELIAGDVEARAAIPRGLSPDFAGPLVETLTRKLTQLDALKGDVASSVGMRIEAAHAQLTQAIARYQRAKRLRRVSSLAAAAAIMLVAAAVGTLAYRAAGQADRLHSLCGQQSTSGVRDLVARIKQNEPILLRFPRLSTELAQASRWLEAMDANTLLAHRELQFLENSRREKFADIPSPELFVRLEEAAAMVATLPPDIAAESAARLSVLRNDSDRALLQRQEASDQQALAVAARWTGVLEQINTSGPATAAGRALESASNELAPYLKLAALQHPSLRLPGSTEAMITDVDSRVRAMVVRVEASSSALKILEQAVTTEAYRDALTQLADGGFSEGIAARKIVDSWPAEDQLKALLAFRGNMLALQTASNDVLGNSPVPETAVAPDREVITELISSEALNKLWVVEWQNNKGKILSCFSQGKLTHDANTGWSGQVADYPKFASENLKFKEAFIVSSAGNVMLSNKPTATSTMMERLQLPRLLDDSGTKFRASVLPMLDWVANDAEAKPLAKAYVWGRLMRLLSNHKPEEWGLHYCPGLIDEIKAFQELEMKFPLPQSAWMLEQAPSYAKAWEDYFFARGKRSSYDELRKTRAAAIAIHSGSVNLAGHVATDGNVILTPSKGNRLLLALCDVGDNVYQLKVCGIAVASIPGFIPTPKALPLSPLFFINLPDDSQTFLLSIHRSGESKTPNPRQQ